MIDQDDLRYISGQRYSIGLSTHRLQQTRHHYLAMRQEHDNLGKCSNEEGYEIQGGPIGNQRKEDQKHCQTCTCEHLSPVYNDLSASLNSKSENRHSHTCQDDYTVMELPLPPPLPEPKYTYHRRVLPSSLIQFSSPEGRVLFQQALGNGTAEAFFPLAEQFLNQSDPAFCGVTTLIMVLNAIGIDPNIRWKGGWRWYGNEEMILDSCCINKERVRRAGILMEEFMSLGKCQGLDIEMKRPMIDDFQGELEDQYSLESFREDIIRMAANPPLYHIDHEDHLKNESFNGGFVVVSFSRFSLDQTGDGHFSPIAAYHKESDRCLVLDVARFKYAPYWVSVTDLYNATKPYDALTGKSRGWFIVHPPRENFKGTKTRDEAKKDVDQVPIVGEQRGSKTCSLR